MDDLPELLTTTDVIRIGVTAGNESKYSHHVGGDLCVHTPRRDQIEPPQLLAFHQLSKNSATPRLCPVSRWAIRTNRSKAAFCRIEMAMLMFSLHPINARHTLLALNRFFL